MRLCHFALAISLTVGASLRAQDAPSSNPIQQPPKPPQTARQALLEMFLGKSPDSFVKHLPKAARQMLIGKGETPETSIVYRISMIGHQLEAEGHLETFDDGPSLIVSESEEGSQKIRTEITVEHDSFSGENDEIELSIHIYRDGEPEFIPVIPHLTFSMIQEDGIWKLDETDLSARIPLTDPEYLKGVRHKINEQNENMAQLQLGILAQSESTFKAKHPGRGYTCSLTDLSAKPAMAGAAVSSDSPSVPAASGAPTDGSSGILIMGGNPMGNDSWGYHFEASGCDGSPATKFQLTATPLDADAGMKAFCSDESKAFRFDAGGSATACLSQGQPVKSIAGSGPD